MAIDPKLVSIIPASELPTGDPTSAGEFFFFEGNEMQKAPMTNIYDKVVGNFSGTLMISDTPTPTEPTWYFAGESGTYTNAGGLVVDLNGKLVVLNYDGINWIKVEVDLTAVIVNGIVEEGNTQAVSGGEVYNAIKPSIDLVNDTIVRKNLFNKNDLIDGWLTNTGGGALPGTLVLSQVEGWMISNFIKVERGFYTITTDGLWNIVPRLAALYDSPTLDQGKSGIRITQPTFEVTTDFAYFAMTVKSPTDTLDLDLIQLERGSIASAVVPYTDVKVVNSAIQKAGIIQEENDLTVSSDDVFKHTKALYDLTVRDNYFNKSLPLVDGVMLASGGEIPLNQLRMTQNAGVASWKMIQPIFLTKGFWTIQFNGDININPLYAGLFSLNTIGNDIFGTRITNKTFEVTEENGSWLFLNASNGTTELDLNTIKLEQGSIPTPYTPYENIYLDGDKIQYKNQVLEGDIEVLINENNIFISTDNQDGVNNLIYKFQYNKTANTNGNFSANSTYIVPKNISISSDLTSYLQHNTSDSISALGTPAYWFILGQHGYLIPRATATGNDFTVGQDVKDSRGSEFKVIYKTGNFVFLEPKITVVGNDIQRSWNNGETFTTLSNLNDSGLVNVTAVSNYQVKPMLNKSIQKVFIDGKEISDLGLYRGNTLKLMDVFKCVNPIGATYNLSGSGLAMQGTDLIEVSQSYFFKGKSNYSSTFINMKDWLPLDKYHGIQPLGLMPLGSYKPYVIFPKVNPKSLAGRTTVDWNYPTDVSSTSSTQYAQYTYANTSSDLVTVNDLTDRTIQFHKTDAGDYGLGFASGLDLVNGINRKDNWHNVSDQAFGFSQGTSTSNKTYFRALRGQKFQDGVLPITFIGQFNGYFAYYLPDDNCQSYVVHTEDCSYVYIHTQELFDKKEIKVDNINGKALSVVESLGIELLTDKALNNSIFIKSNDANANYLVLKTE